MTNPEAMNAGSPNDDALRTAILALVRTQVEAGGGYDGDDPEVLPTVTFRPGWGQI